MRTLAALALLVAGCHIADVHFTGGNVDANGGGDGPADAPHTFDAPFAVAGHGYLVDTNAGIFLLAMSSGGDPAFTGTVYPGGTRSAVINRAAKRLYAVMTTSPPILRTYAIQPDGTLMAMPGDQSIPCPGGDSALSPNGSLLVVGCVNNPMVVTYHLDAQGLPSAPTTQQVGSGVGALSPSVVAFTTPNCLFVGDTMAAAGANSLYPFQVDASGALVMQQPAGGGTRSLALATNPPQNSVLYVATPGSLLSHALGTACNIGATTNVPTTGAAQAIVADPLGKNLFVSGTDVFSYSISAGNAQPNTGNPYLANSPSMTGAALDPMGTHLYLTSPGFSGVLHAQVSQASGAITQNSAPASSPAAANARMFLLGL